MCVYLLCKAIGRDRILGSGLCMFFVMGGVQGYIWGVVGLRIM